MDIGFNLFVFRRIAGLTRPEMAEILGVNKDKISRIERGIQPPDEAYLNHFCGIFHIRKAKMLQDKGRTARELAGLVSLEKNIRRKEVENGAASRTS